MRFTNVLILAAVMFPPLTFASDKHDDAHAKHGGVAVEAGTYHLELVAKDKGLTVYLNGHDDKPFDTKGVKATANVFSGKDKALVELKPAGGNVLKGEMAFVVQTDAKVVVSFTLPGKKAEQARFSLGRKQDHKGHKH